MRCSANELFGDNGILTQRRTEAVTATKRFNWRRHRPVESVGIARLVPDERQLPKIKVRVTPHRTPELPLLLFDLREKETSARKKNQTRKRMKI
jgi:hypothetical protein